MGIHWRHFGRKTLQVLCLVSTQCTYVPHCNNSTQYYYPVGRLQSPISQCLNPGRFYKLSITLISLSRQSSCTRREHPPEEKKLKSHYLFDGGKKRDTSLHQLLRQKSTELVSKHIRHLSSLNQETLINFSVFKSFLLKASFFFA